MPVRNCTVIQLPGDNPGKPTGKYYALVKKGGKQFRRSLKTKDRLWPKADAIEPGRTIRRTAQIHVVGRGVAADVDGDGPGYV